MPRREDLETILVLGSGPIKIGQAAEFDFSGSQAVQALREDGYKVILVNSNPATIQNDPEMADKVYIEPLLPDTIKRIIEIERPDALLAGMGGQTALNIASDLAHAGVLDELGVELIGSDLDAIDKAEDRDLFNKVCLEIDLPISNAIACNSMDDVLSAADEIGSWPILIRPAFTLGGLGGGTAWNTGELVEIATLGLRNSRIGQVLIEESILGWQEYEYEVMRDTADNATIVCTMENIDPMGVHTGESTVVAPVQSLSDRDHMQLRDMSLSLIRKLNIKGGCNVQFAVNQSTGEVRVIEVNPRDVSVNSLMAEMQNAFTTQANEKGLSLKVSGPDLAIHTDRLLQERILRNLISNAINYTKYGSVDVSWHHEKLSNSIEIVITDTGIGIPESQIENIFSELQLPMAHQALDLFVNLNIYYLHYEPIANSAKNRLIDVDCLVNAE